MVRSNLDGQVPVVWRGRNKRRNTPREAFTMINNRGVQTKNKSRQQKFLTTLVILLSSVQSIRLLFCSNIISGSLKRTESIGIAEDEIIWRRETLNLFYQTENATDSLKVLFKTALYSSSALADDDDEVINLERERERCDRYGYNYSDRRNRRRIFWGSLLADDSWHILSIAAIEYYGLLSFVSLIESNTTQTLQPRIMRFPSGSESLKILSSPLLWGPETKVSVDYYYDPPSETRKGLQRENLQRDKIIDRWKAHGMTQGDVGFISDVDEIVSRDFLRALQICDVPEFAPGQDCINSKISAAAIVFEGSPMCLTQNRRWFHPDMVIGECVDQIGNLTLHPPVNRVFDKGVNMREKDWRSNRTMGPLWDATDFRMTLSRGSLTTGEGGSHTAYHLNNFLDSIALVRNNYPTDIHPVYTSRLFPLSEIHSDVGFMVDCLTGQNASGIFKRVPGGYQSLKSYQMPVAFQRAPKYPILRHSELQQLLEEEQQAHHLV